MVATGAGYEGCAACPVLSSLYAYPNRKKLQVRPEFKLKLTLGGHFGFFRGFSSNPSVWILTAAQRALLLGPTIEDVKKEAPRLSLAAMQAMTEAGQEQREARKSAQAEKEKKETEGE